MEVTVRQATPGDLVALLRFQQGVVEAERAFDPTIKDGSVHIDALKTWCRARQITELRLEVYNGNRAAIRAYQKQGFAEHMLEMRLGLTDATAKTDAVGLSDAKEKRRTPL
jgi:hypothetical protein